MVEPSSPLADTLLAHGYCLKWSPGLIGLHVVSDALITIAYYSIPLTLLYFVRHRRDLAFHWIFLMFGAFIFACGTTHVMEIWTLWDPAYLAEGWLKAFTAAISVATAVSLIPIIPKALALPSPSELEAANRRLAGEVAVRQRAERELERQARDLERSNAELAQFAYVASHDLQEPLRMVASYVQLLSRRYRGKLDADADEFIGFAVDGAERMQNLIRDLLALSRLGTRSGTLVSTDVGRALRDALANLREAVTESGAVVEVGPMPTLTSDGTRLVQLFQNLIGNAIKFRGANAARVRVTATRQGDLWTISVADNGIGIDAKNAARVFDVFQRLHHRDEYPGNGIGLAVCRKVVEQLGGQIWLESTVGRGTTFHFTHPTSPVLETEPATPETDGASAHPA